MGKGQGCPDKRQGKSEVCEAVTEHEGFERQLLEHFLYTQDTYRKFDELKSMCHPSDEGYYDKLIMLFQKLESKTHTLLSTFRGSVMEEFNSK